MANAVSKTNVKDNPQDARVAAERRINGALNQFRMLGNTTSWALSPEDRNSMADAIEAGAVELVAQLRGTVASSDGGFTF